MTLKNHQNKSKEREDMYDKNGMQFIYEDNDPLGKMFYCHEHHEKKIIQSMADNGYGLYNLRIPHPTVQVNHLRDTGHLFNTFLRFKRDSGLKFSAMYIQLLDDLKEGELHNEYIEKSLSDYFNNETHLRNPNKQM